MFLFFFKLVSFITKLSYKMLTTTAVKSMVMLLLVASATVSADDMQKVNTPCKIIDISDATVDYCCPCASTIFGGSCLSTIKGTCGRFGFDAGFAATKCPRGQWSCHQDRPDFQDKIEALLSKKTADYLKDEPIPFDLPLDQTFNQPLDDQTFNQPLA